MEKRGCAHRGEHVPRCPSEPPTAAENRGISLDGFDEVPVVITNGTGLFRYRIDGRETQIEYVLSYEDLEPANGVVTQAHIHLGQRHTTGAIVLWLCANNPPITPPATIPVPPACPPSPGTVSGTLTKADVITLLAQGVGPQDLAAVIEAIRRGVAYVNVHTTVSTSGVIRGQFFGKH